MNTNKSIGIGLIFLALINIALLLIGTWFDFLWDIIGIREGYMFIGAMIGFGGVFMPFFVGVSLMIKQSKEMDELDELNELLEG